MSLFDYLFVTLSRRNYLSCHHEILHTCCQEYEKGLYTYTKHILIFIIITVLHNRASEIAGRSYFLN